MISELENTLSLHVLLLSMIKSPFYCEVHVYPFLQEIHIVHLLGRKDWQERTLPVLSFERNKYFCSLWSDSNSLRYTGKTAVDKLM